MRTKNKLIHFLYIYILVGQQQCWATDQTILKSKNVSCNDIYGTMCLLYYCFRIDVIGSTSNDRICINDWVFLS